MEQRIFPMLSYEDGAAAIEWLTRAFGFTEVEGMRHTEPDGTVTHAELRLGDGRVMLATPTPDYVSPKRHRITCDAARAWMSVPYVIDGVLVMVDDVDAQFGRARDAGATILSEPADQSVGIRHYRAEDLEGHRWMFAQELGTG